MKEASIKRKELYILIILGLCFIILIQFLLGIVGLVHTSLITLVSFLIASILLMSLFWGTVRWKTLSYFFFVWLLLEGIFRKWIAPDLSTFLYFVKHLILVGPYFYLLTKGIKLSKKHYPFLGPLLVYVVWGVLEVFNFRVANTFLVPILGLITHFWFIPLIFLIPTVFDTEEKILKFFRMMVYISFPIFILGIVQYFSPIGSVINQYAPNEAAGEIAIATVGQHARITGIFSYMTPYKGYLGFVMSVILCLLVMGNSKRTEVIILCIALGLGAINMLMIGSRSGVVFLILNSAFFVFIYFSFKGRLRVKKKVFIRFGLIIFFFLLFAVFFTNIGREAVSSFVERAQSAQRDVLPRIVHIFSFFRFLPEAGLVGYGIGTAHQGARALQQEWGDMPRVFEAEWERIFLEFGLIGFIFVMLLRIYILANTWKVFKRTKTYDLKLIALIAFIHQLPIVAGLSIVYDYMASIIFWSSVGLVITVDRLERINATKNFSVPVG